MSDALERLERLATTWGPKPPPSLVAVHLLLLHVLADKDGRTARDPRRDLVRILGVDARTIRTALEILEARGAVRREDDGRISLTISATAPRPADPTIRDADPTIRDADPTIRDADPTIRDADPTIRVSRRAAINNNLFEDPQEQALQAMLGARARHFVDDLLATCAAYVPRSDDGRECRGRRVDADAPGARGAAAGVLLAEGAARKADAALATCKDYVERFAALCTQDSRQRGFWSLRMLSTERVSARRKSAWEVVKDAVDRAALAPTVSTSGAVRPAYGGKGAEL